MKCEKSQKNKKCKIFFKTCKLKGYNFVTKNLSSVFRKYLFFVTFNKNEEIFKKSALNFFKTP